MITARLHDRGKAPLWITLGAPLVGVPLLVGLLSLVTPSTPAVEEELSVVEIMPQTASPPTPTDLCFSYGDELEHHTS